MERTFLPSLRSHPLHMFLAAEGTGQETELSLCSMSQQ
jgi:hypothetical protein